MRFTLDDKVVLVTGATGGIGMATARLLHEKGARLVLTGRRQGVLDELERMFSGRALTARADVTDSGELQAVVSAAVSRFGGIDVLFANAGTLVDPPRTVATTDPNAFEFVIDVDLLGAWRSVHAALPQIIARRGHILLTSSIFAYCNGGVDAAYAVSKAGIEQLGRALRVELAPHGATAGVLFPGFTDTPLARPAFGGDAVVTELVRRVFPASLRRPVLPEEVAAAAVRGIERRSARITVPRRWMAVSALRGLINPAVDAVIEHDPATKRLILELERRARRESVVPTGPRARIR